MSSTAETFNAGSKTYTKRVWKGMEFWNLQNELHYFLKVPASLCLSQVQTHLIAKDMAPVDVNNLAIVLQHRVEEVVSVGGTSAPTAPLPAAWYVKIGKTFKWIGLNGGNTRIPFGIRWGLVDLLIKGVFLREGQYKFSVEAHQVLEVPVPGEFTPQETEVEQCAPEVHAEAPAPDAGTQETSCSNCGGTYCEEYGVICDGAGGATETQSDTASSMPPPTKKKRRSTKQPRTAAPPATETAVSEFNALMEKQFGPEWQPRDGDETHWDHEAKRWVRIPNVQFFI